jgi:arginase
MKMNEVKKSIQIIGVPLDLGASRRGTDGGPSSLRIAGLDDGLKKLGYNIRPDLDIAVRPPVSRATDENEQLRFKPEILKVCQDLAKATKNVLLNGDIPLTIGGDHSVAIGSVSGIASYYQEQDQNIGLIWFDAHADMNVPVSSPSGIIHGMPLSHLLGYGDKDFTDLMGARPKVKPENVVLIGIRDVDSEERKLIKELGIKVYSMRDIDELGMDKVSSEAIEIATKNTVGFHVSFDVDGCDPDVIPGSGTLVLGGVSFREAHLLLEKCADTQLMTSMDMVELNPFLDHGNISAERSVSLIQSAFGSSIV